MLFNLEKSGYTKKILLLALLIILIIFLDYITGNEISVSIFYLIPITFTHWYISKKASIFISVISAVLWFLTDLSFNPEYSHFLIPYWNALVRLGFFISVTLMLGLIKEEREKEKEIVQFIAHDLRSPLANIKTSLELLNDDTEETLLEGQRELVEPSITTANRMMIFINSLLDIGRLEKNKLPINISNEKVSDIIESAVAQVKLLAREKNIEIKQECLVENINADGNLLLRIMVNLIGNAIKVSDKDTEIKISARNLDEDKIMFTIKDQGPGIQKGFEKKLFDKYNQGNAFVSGTGIGLTFCKLAVEAHKGYIKLENAEGGGTIVTFVLNKNI